jgi:two-component system nitrogen regulation response regulator GlnG
MRRVLVVDDSLQVQALFAEFLDSGAYSLATALSAQEARASFAANRPDVVILDVRLPDGSGLDLFDELRAIDATVPVLLITAAHSSAIAIEAMKRGAYDYLLKPLDMGQVRSLVERALAMRRLMAVPVALGEEPDNGDVFTGRCAAMQEVYKSIGRVASQEVTVLIRGETGTGKELVARVLYQHSPRVGKPFLAINCAAIPEGLLESELFGHEKGAFTGAERKHIGKFEQCNGGTLFLDEVGDMPPALQSKILRVLQEQQLQRVGGNETIRVDVRLLAATNRDLEKAVAAGTFRADLYYRLNGFTISLPPLRERAEDLPLLVDHLLGRLAQELGQPRRRVADGTMAVLQSHSWPGNVRELQSVLRQGLLRSSGPLLMAESLALPGQAKQALPLSSATTDWARFVTDHAREPAPNLYARALEQMERTLLPLVLQQTLGNQTAAAELLGITRGSLRYKLRSLGIDVDEAARTGTARPPVPQEHPTRSS